MPLLTRNFDVRSSEDRQELLRILASTGTYIEESAIEFAIAQLTDDWFGLKTLDICPLVITKSGSFGAIHIFEWATLLRYLYEFRNHKRIEDQIRRLRLSSHEKIDTILVILVAG